MLSEEHVEQSRVADDARVVLDLHGLGVAGRARARLLIGRLLLVPAGVADLGRQHAGLALVHKLHRPEATGWNEGHAQWQSTDHRASTVRRGS